MLIFLLNPYHVVQMLNMFIMTSNFCLQFFYKFLQHMGFFADEKIGVYASQPQDG